MVAVAVEHLEILLQILRLVLVVVLVLIEIHLHQEKVILEIQHKKVLFTHL